MEGWLRRRNWHPLAIVRGLGRGKSSSESGSCAEFCWKSVNWSGLFLLQVLLAGRPIGWVPGRLAWLAFCNSHLSSALCIICNSSRRPVSIHFLYWSDAHIHFIISFACFAHLHFCPPQGRATATTSIIKPRSAQTFTSDSYHYILLCLPSVKTLDVQMDELCEEAPCLFCYNMDFRCLHGAVNKLRELWAYFMALCCKC